MEKDKKEVKQVTSRLNVVIDKELYKSFKLKCYQNDSDITEVITLFVQEYVSKN